MRKITSLVICIFMLAALALPAMAAEESGMTFKLTADKTELVAGDTVTIMVEVDKGVACSNFGVIVKYDKTKFEFVEVDNIVGDVEYTGGMKQGILADPSGKVDENIFAASNNGDPYPGVGGWNVEAVEGSQPEQTTSVPYGKVGFVVLKSIVAEGTVDVTTEITGIASVDGGTKTSTVAPVTIEFVENKGLLGDVNGDECVDSFDAALILIYDLDPTTDFEGQYGEKFILANANVSGAIEDGEEGIIDSFDAALILMKDLDPDYVFPAEY